MTATPTWDLITETVLSSPASSVTFGSGGTLTQAYKDLVLEIVASTSANGNGLFQFNGDSGANYSTTTIRGDGSSATSIRTSDARLSTIGVGPAAFTITLHVMSYSSGSVYKTSLVRYSDAAQVTGASAVLWRSTSAITSILASFSGGNFATGSTFRLYGLV